MLSTVELGSELVEIDHFAQEELQIATDREELEVVGIAEGDTVDTIYFADTYNSKLKRLNIKTRQVDEVRY